MGTLPMPLIQIATARGTLALIRLRGSDVKDRTFIYDGKAFTVYAPELGYYATVAAPPTIHETLDKLYSRFGLALPLEDLFRWGDATDTGDDVLDSAFKVGPSTIAVPLIGDLSSERASEIAERVLPAVQSGRHRFVILDLTGCREVDETGARGLSRLTSAVELLGARCILTGITPTLAQTMVTAKLDLTRLVSLRSLSDGMAYCRRSLLPGGAVP